MNKVDPRDHLLCVIKSDIFYICVCESLKLNTLKIELPNNVISTSPPFQKTVFELRIK